MSPEEFTQHLEAHGQRVQKTHQGWMAQCPAHEDRAPSLSLSLGQDDRILVNCHAGCETEDVLAAVGLELRDLFDAPAADRPTLRAVPSRPKQQEPPKPLPSDAQLAEWQEAITPKLLERLAERKGWSEPTLRRLGIGWHPDRQRLTIPVRDADGQLLAVQLYQPGGEPKMLPLHAGYPRGLFPAPESIAGDTVWIVEGEPDAITAHQLGLPAVAIPGTSAAGRVATWAGRFNGRARVNVLCDCDTPGREAAATMAAELAKYVPDVRVVDLEPGRDDHYDLGDFLAEAEPGEGPQVAELVRALADRASRVELAEAEVVPLPVASTGADAVDGWPAPLGKAAYHGIVGEVLDVVMPHTEADAAAILVQLLAAFGSACGRGPGFTAEGDFHATNLFVVLVGQSSKGRKGTSWGRVSQLMRLADEDWLRERVQSGLASGEGLIHAVRDPVYLQRKEGSEPELQDEGVSDKRLLAHQGEFAQVLRVMRREGNTLSAVIRDLWDKGDGRTMTKGSPSRATGALVSIVGHITLDELRREMTSIDASNGFTNRFLFVCTKRSKMLPFGGSLSDDELAELGGRLRRALRFATVQTEIPFDDAARELWASEYERLSTGWPGMFGSATSRSEAQTRRLAVLYALLDESEVVRSEHLRAALAVWRYCEDSARFIFKGNLGNPFAHKLLEYLRHRAGWVTRTDLRTVVGNSVPADDVTAALRLLREQGLAELQDKKESPQTGQAGRTPEMWRAVSDRAVAA